MKRVWLERVLQNKKMTHQEAANLIGIERSYFTQIVNGRRRPSPEVAQKIGQALGFDWTIFFNCYCGVKPHDNQAATVEPEPAA
ncbi:helix-turn-helix domain-containing protein [Thermosinus carboxydivorans]|uniref:helix-turn-helix domain-containing protein n=1 Tax=Thermosinus carboxydivorans TaxID=261685 RepID=UPI00030EB889|nr:helix-turn-helix transcriptional regulator [Thermosinus carboxydivorans]